MDKPLIQSISLMGALFVPAIVLVLALHWDGHRFAMDDERTHVASVELK